MFWRHDLGACDCARSLKMTMVGMMPFVRQVSTANRTTVWSSKTSKMRVTTCTATVKTACCRDDQIWLIERRILVVALNLFSKVITG